MKQLIFFSILFSSGVAFSQQVLSFEEVIKRTLEKNFDVLIEPETDDEAGWASAEALIRRLGDEIGQQREA